MRGKGKSKSSGGATKDLVDFVDAFFLIYPRLKARSLFFSFNGAAASEYYNFLQKYN